MVNEQHVLLVDGQAETETVLRTVLEPQGVSVSRVRGGLRPTVQPSLVVLHEGPDSAAWPGVPRVVIGRAPAMESPRGECGIDRPFEYRELVATIDRMLKSHCKAA